MRIDIWSDIVCPFCAIGKAALDQAVAQTGAEVEIVHHAFRLQPDAAPEPVETMLARKYGLRGAQADAQQKRVTDMAAQVGLDFHLSGTLIGDTGDAHVLLALAAEKDLQIPLLNTLYDAYFSKNKNVFDRETLFAIGEEVGLTRPDMAAALADANLAARVAQDEQTARAHGVNGVPFFVFDDRYALSGAQPVATFAAALRQIQAETPAEPSGAVCGPDGCAE
jgi:predicted DsbA family dithiol-disulfide isomerase